MLVEEGVGRKGLDFTNKREGHGAVGPSGLDEEAGLHNSLICFAKAAGGPRPGRDA